MSNWYFNCVNDINTFAHTYGNGSTFKSVDLNMLIENRDALDDCLDFILDLYCSIGQGNYEKDSCKQSGSKQALVGFCRVATLLVR